MTWLHHRAAGTPRAVCDRLSSWHECVAQLGLGGSRAAVLRLCVSSRKAPGFIKD